MLESIMDWMVLWLNPEILHTKNLDLKKVRAGNLLKSNKIPKLHSWFWPEIFLQLVVSYTFSIHMKNFQGATPFKYSNLVGHPFVKFQGVVTLNFAQWLHLWPTGRWCKLLQPHLFVFLVFVLGQVFPHVFIYFTATPFLNCTAV